MSCNNIQDISANMCNKICSENIPASNTELLNNCNTKCNEQIIGELNPLDITNNFIFVNSADVVENTLDRVAGLSEDLYNKSRDNINDIIQTMENKSSVSDANCTNRIGAKWTKVINGQTNEIINTEYIKTFKNYSAFGLKWKKIDTRPNGDNFNELAVDTNGITQESYQYLVNALSTGTKDANNIVTLTKLNLIDNNLFVEDSTENLKIFPNSYIKLSDNSYYKVANYDLSAQEFNEIKPIFNRQNANTIDLKNENDFKNVFFDLTIDDFVMNDNGDIYLPDIGCTNFEDTTQICDSVKLKLQESEPCYVDNKDNSYIKRKDTIPYLFDKTNGCINKTLNFNNKNELYDIINKVANNTEITTKLNEMMGKYDETKYNEIKQIIDQILDDSYSDYFTTNDFLDLFDVNFQYWIKISDDILNSRNIGYPSTPSGKYDVSSAAAVTNYDKIAEIISKYVTTSTPFNFLVQLSEDDTNTLIALNIQFQKNLWFKVIHEDGTYSNFIMYRPLNNHIDIRESVYFDSCYNTDWSSKGGLDYYTQLSNGQKEININNSSGSYNYGVIGNDIGYYNNVILSSDYITQDQCTNLQFEIDDTEFNSAVDTFNQYVSADGKFEQCIRNSENMLNYTEYQDTIQYNDINTKFLENAEFDKKYKLYSDKVNKYEGSQTSCRYSDELNSELETKKDSLKTYIFNQQKNYYVGKETTFNLKKWSVTDTAPTIGLELVNQQIKNILDDNYIAIGNVIELSDSDVAGITINGEIDNNTYIKSIKDSQDIYYVYIPEQTDCRQPANYKLQNSADICGTDMQCAFENEYEESIRDISAYDDNECSDMLTNLNYCYNKDYDIPIGKQINYSTCKDDIPDSEASFIDCTTADPTCNPGQYITYEKDGDGKYTCTKICASCPDNTTLDTDGKCKAVPGYYFDYTADPLPAEATQCPSEKYNEDGNATSESDCNTCEAECGHNFYELQACTPSTNRVCEQLPANSSKSGTGFVCNANYIINGDGDECLPCGYGMERREGEQVCSPCPALGLSSEDGFYNMYSYNPGCDIEEDIECRMDEAIDCREQGGTAIFTRQVERRNGRPILYKANGQEHPNQEEAIQDWINIPQKRGSQLKHKCLKSCQSCGSNEKLLSNGLCEACPPGKIQNPDDQTADCVYCNYDGSNEIFNSVTKACEPCADWLKAENNVCLPPSEYNYYNANKELIQIPDNQITLGHIKIDNWEGDKILAIIFDYSPTVVDIPEIYVYDVSGVAYTFTSATDADIENDEYYKISNTIKIFTPAPETEFFIKNFSSIYIQNGISLPNNTKLILKIENSDTTKTLDPNLPHSSYYLLSDGVKAGLESENTSFELIYDMEQNKTNELYTCPNNTFVYDLNGFRNICKFFDVGYYRYRVAESFENYDKYDSRDSRNSRDSSLSSDTTIESFANYENFYDGRTQLHCSTGFDPTYLDGITISSTLGGTGDGNIQYEGCNYECAEEGHYYDVGAEPNKSDNQCIECPVGTKCPDKILSEPCLGGEGKYQNEPRQKECKSIPSGGFPISEDDTIGNIGFRVPAGKQYKSEDPENEPDNRVISDCPQGTYKDSPSIINNLTPERDENCTSCPANSDTDDVGKTDISDCNPVFGYEVSTGELGYQIVLNNKYIKPDGQSLQCNSGNYFGTLAAADCAGEPGGCIDCQEDDGSGGTVNIKKACIACPPGYQCLGGPAVCGASPQINLETGNFGTLTPPFEITGCTGGMKFDNVRGECVACEYLSGENEVDKYCPYSPNSKLAPETHLQPTASDIILRKGDNYTQTVLFPSSDKNDYKIQQITSKTDSLDIDVSFNSHIPSNIDSFSEEDIITLKDAQGTVLYLYKYASGIKTADNTIVNPFNINQLQISDTINLNEHGYISDQDQSTNSIKNLIESNNLKLENDDMKNLCDIIINWQRAQSDGTTTKELSFIHDIQIYNNDEIQTYTYIYKILPYRAVCSEGHQTLDGLTCTLCPYGTYKTAPGEEGCIAAGVGGADVYEYVQGQGGTEVSYAPNDAAVVMLNDGEGQGNYGFEIRNDYLYDGRDPNNIIIAQCEADTYSPQTTIYNSMGGIDRLEENIQCSSCQAPDSLPPGQLGVQPDGAGSCIPTCEDLYILDSDSNQCVLNQCAAGTYYNSVSESCETCDPNKYCPGGVIDREVFAPIQSPCPTGTSSLAGAQSINECTAVGYYYDSSTNDVVQCPTGTSSPAGAQSINDCIAKKDYYGEAGRVATECPEGTTTLGAGSTSVDACTGPGFYFDRGSVLSCTTGYYCVGDGSRKLAAGYGYNITDQAPYACPAGTYRSVPADINDQNIDCIPCTGYDYTQNEASTEVSTVPVEIQEHIEMIKDDADNNIGYQLKEGHGYDDTSGYYECPAGTHRSGAVDFTTGPSEKLCLECRGSTYQPDTGQATCLEATDNNINLEHIEMIKDADDNNIGYQLKEGHGYDATQGSYECDTGTYRSGTVIFTDGATPQQCDACPTGSTTTTKKNTSADACVATLGYKKDSDGNFVLAEGYTLVDEEIQCAAGYYSGRADWGQDPGCYPCNDVGSYCPGGLIIGAPGARANYFTCPSETTSYPSGNFNMGKCISTRGIKQGYRENGSYGYIIDENENRVNDGFLCNLGYEKNAATKGCTECPVGTAGGGEDRMCSPCDGDRAYSSVTGLTSCETVPNTIIDNSFNMKPNSVSGIGGNIGYKLKPGYKFNYFNYRPNTTEECGNEAYRSGDVDITDHYSDVDCTGCPPYSETKPITTAHELNQCKAKSGFEPNPDGSGGFVAKEGRTSDGQGCLPGYYYDGGECIQCPVGYKCTGDEYNAVDAIMEMCPKGTYQDTPRQSDCKTPDQQGAGRVGRGYFGIQEGATSFDTSPGSSFFAQCPENTSITGDERYDSIWDCTPEVGYEMIPDEPDGSNSVEVKSSIELTYDDAFAKFDEGSFGASIATSSSSTNCIPGTVINGDKCEILESYDPTKYYDGTTGNGSTKAPGASGQIKLTPDDDMYTNDYYVDMSTLKIQNISRFHSPPRVICNGNHRQIEAHEEPNSFDTFYIYSYVDPSPSSISYYYFNDPGATNAREAIEFAIENNYSINITADTLYFDKLKNYLQMQPPSGSQEVAYLKSIPVYNPDTGTTELRHYVYRILPMCVSCLGGETLVGDTCQPCPRGDGKAFNGSETYLGSGNYCGFFCLDGYTKNGSVCTKDDCAVGEYYDGSSCQSCPTGHYCPGGKARSGADVARKYPKPIGVEDVGYRMTTSEDGDLYPELLPGYKYNSSARTITQCEQGTYRSGTQEIGNADINCSRCSLGQTSSSGAANCQNCLAGQYESSNRCLSATGNYFTSTPGRSTRDEVPANIQKEQGSYQMITQNSNNIGYKLNAGYGYNSTEGSYECPKGTYRSGNVDFSNGVTTQQCDACPSNRTTPSTRSTAELDCSEAASGYYKYNDEIQACPGYPNVNSSGATSVSDCMYSECPTGYYRDANYNCQLFDTSITRSNCETETGKIFIPGKQSVRDSSSPPSFSHRISPNEPTDYTQTGPIGHDNTCISYSEICSDGYIT